VIAVVVTVMARLQLDLPGVTSLKEKRRILKSLMSRLRQDFNLSIAEVGSNDVLRRCELGAAVVANDIKHASRVMDKAINKIESNYEVVLAHVSTEAY